jgi:daunorubicin resistance ABC transporter ATP-binding subunit
MADPIITVHDLTKRFRGGTVERDRTGRRVDAAPALDRLSLSVPAGIVYGLLGPNGAGKTTLIRILATLLLPDSGVARVAGFDVRQDPESVRARIGLAGQHAAVDAHLTGRENVEMIGRLYGLSRHDARTRAAAVVERIGLGEAANRQVRTYSGGMRRRIDLAASLVGRPRVLFLDEPTTGVDPTSRRALWDLIDELVDDGTTVVLTTQYLEEADRLATRIGVLDHGRLLGEGTPNQLKRHTGPTVLRVSIPEPQRARAVEALRGLAPQPPAQDPARGVLVLPAADGITTLRTALRALDEAGITPTDVGLHQPTLDDVFLGLTASGTPNREAAA